VLIPKKKKQIIINDVIMNDGMINGGCDVM